MVIEMTPLEIGFALAIIINLILFIVTSFRVDVLYKLMWKVHNDMSEQVEDLIERKELPDRHLVKKWREGLAESEKGSPAYYAYKNKLHEYNLL